MLDCKLGQLVNRSPLRYLIAKPNSPISVIRDPSKNNYYNTCQAGYQVSMYAFHLKSPREIFKAKHYYLSL